MAARVPIAGFAFANSLLGLVAIGDVHQHVHRADQSSRRIEQRRWIGNEGYTRAVRPFGDGLHPSDWAPLFQRQGHRAFVMRQRGAIGPIELPGAAEFACAELRPESPQLRRSLIVECNPPSRVGRVQRRRQGLQKFGLSCVRLRSGEAELECGSGFSRKTFTAPTTRPESALIASIFTSATMRVPSGRSITISWSRSPSPVARTSAMGHFAWGTWRPSRW